MSKRICNHCGGEVFEKTATIGDDWEGASVCEDCGAIEGGDHEEEDEENCDDWDGDDNWYLPPIVRDEHSEYL